jgi:DNA-binding winged helix-turn-helix (wHTH) protein
MSEFYNFGPFRVEVADRLLLRQSQPIHVTSKMFDTLVLLLRNRGHLVGKRELIQHAWGDKFVEEGNLAFTICVLRKALCPNNLGEQQYIETVAKHGYRFRRLDAVMETAPDQEFFSRRDRTKSAPPQGEGWASSETCHH